MDQDIESALKVLRQGGTILYPTETIWGIGCDATQEDAVKKIYRIKKREDVKSMLVLLADASKLDDYVRIIPDIARELIEIADKPLTLVYPGAINLAPNLPGEDGSIGIRITTDIFCRKLIYQLGRPLVSTSANVSGQPPPGNFTEIAEEIKTAVDYVVKWRQADTTVVHPSSVIRVGVNNEVVILRK